MVRIPIRDVGLRGVILDAPPQFLPSNIWTGARNMRMREDGAVRISGDLQFFGTPSVAPKWAMGVPGISGAYYWLYSDGAAVYVWNGSTHTDITKVATTYSATDAGLWTGTLLSDIPILNNGIDPPQFWAKPLSVATKLADLSNWPANTLAEVIRAFGPYLLALNVTKSSVRFPNMVKWSHPADPGALPVSWDHTDPTKDAGEVELTDVAAGGLVDGVVLGNVFVVYKENSAHILRFLNNRFIFDFDPLMESVGLIGKHCARQVPGLGKAFIATGEDIVIHGVQRGEHQSLLDNRARRWLQSSIDSDNVDRAFVVPNEAQKEMWFCFPEAGATWPTTALIWNFVHNTLTFRDLENVSFIANGIVTTVTADTWNSASGTWDTDADKWNAEELKATTQHLLMCLPDSTQMRKADVGNDFNGAAISATVERSELIVIGVDRQGQPILDMETIKLVRRVWVRAKGDPFTVRVGAQEEEDGTTYWSSTETFTPGVDKYVDFTSPISGRFITIRFESTGGMTWKLEGYDLEVEALGEF